MSRPKFICAVCKLPVGEFCIEREEWSRRWRVFLKCHGQEDEIVRKDDDIQDMRYLSDCGHFLNYGFKKMAFDRAGPLAQHKEGE